MSNGPMIRARAYLDAFAYLEKVDPEGAARMRERIPAESAALLFGARKSEWMPVEHDHHISDSWIPVFGEERAIDLIAGSVLVVFETPVLRPLIQGALRLLGVTPSSILKVIPRATGQIYRNFHTERVGETGEDWAIVHFEDIHPEVLRYPSYLFVWRGTFEAVFRLCRCRGSVELAVNHEARSAEWMLRWKPLVSGGD